MTIKSNYTGLGYPFNYQSVNGWVYAGFEHTVEEAIKDACHARANAVARAHYFGEPKPAESLNKFCIRIQNITGVSALTVGKIEHEEVVQMMEFYAPENRDFIHYMMEHNN